MDGWDVRLDRRPGEGLCGGGVFGARVWTLGAGLLALSEWPRRASQFWSGPLDTVLRCNYVCTYL